MASGLGSIVGVNVHAGEHVNPPLLKIDHAVEEEQVAALKKLKRERDNAKVQACLERLADAARGSSNLLPPILEAVEAYERALAVDIRFMDLSERMHRLTAGRG